MSVYQKHDYKAKHSYALQKNYVPKHFAEQTEVKKRDIRSTVVALVCLIALVLLRNFALLFAPVVCFVLIYTVLRLTLSGKLFNSLAIIFTICDVGCWVFFSVDFILQILL